MLEVKTERTYKASAWEVWHLMGDFYDVNAWMPGARSVKTDLEMRTRAVLAGNSTDPVVEQLVGEGQWFQLYRIVSGPLPVKDYSAELRVISLDDTRSKVTWGATFQSKDVTDDEATRTVTGIFTHGLAEVEKALAARHNADLATAPTADEPPVLKLNPEERDRLFAPILAALEQNGAQEKFMFGQRGLVAEGHLFATMFNTAFVVRLIAGTPEYDAALNLSDSIPWKPNHRKKPFGDWVQISIDHSDLWLDFARTALQRLGTPRT